MIKKLEFTKIYIRNSKKKYVYHILELLILFLIFHIVFYHFQETNQIKQTLENIKASELYRADYKVENISNLDLELDNLQKNLPMGLELISPTKNIAFTDQTYKSKQVTLNILSLSEAKQYNYPISKGEEFDLNLAQQDYYQAIIPKELSGKYQIGKEYEIAIEKNLVTLTTIKVKIIGYRNSNYILDSSQASDNIFKRDTTILVFDKYGKLSKDFYAEMNGSIPVILKTKNLSEKYLNSLLDKSNLINIKNLEKSILKLTELKFNDIDLYMTLLFVIIPLIIVSLASFFYLEYQNKKKEYIIYIANGLSPQFLFQSTLVLNAIVFIFPVLLQEIVWYIICLARDYEFVWRQSISIIFISILTTTLITSINTYYISKINYNDKTIDKEITSE